MLTVTKLAFTFIYLKFINTLESFTFQKTRHVLNSGMDPMNQHLGE